MKSFKQYIKNKLVPIYKDDKDRYVIHHSNIGIEKIHKKHKDDKDRFVINTKTIGIRETFHEKTNPQQLYKLNDDIRDLHDRLHSHYDLHNHPNGKIAKLYSCGFNRPVNDLLHNLYLEKTSVDEEPSSHIEGIKNLDKMHKESKEAPEDFHVYTGIKWNPSDLWENDKHTEDYVKISAYPKKSKNVHLHLPAYTSTSISPSAAVEFSRSDKNNIKHVIKLHIPKGSKHGTYIDGASDFGTHSFEDGAEKEFLLKRGTTIELSKTPEKVSGPNSDVHIWHGKIVEHDPINLFSLKDQKLSPNEMKQIINTGDSKTKKILASHPDITPEISEILGNDPDSNVVSSVAQSKLTHPDVLHKLLPKNKHLIDHFVTNPALSSNTIHDVVTKHFPNNMYIHQHIFNHNNTSPKTFSHLIHEYRHQPINIKHILHHPRLSNDNLMQIAKLHPKIYGPLIKEHPHADDEVLDYLDSEGI